MRRSRAVLAAAATALLLSCSHPPQADIDAARAALATAAQNVDVVTYAPDALRAAQEQASTFETELAAQARKPVFMRRYDAVRDLAAGLAELAATAESDAAQSKAEVALDAAVLADEVDSAIPTVETKVWAAKRVPRIKQDIIAAISLVPAQARTTVEDARKDIAAGAFAAAKAKLLAVKDQLANCEETIVEQTRIARSR